MMDPLSFFSKAVVCAILFAVCGKLMNTVTEQEIIKYSEIPGFPVLNRRLLMVQWVVGSIPHDVSNW